ncbi:MAG: Validamycin A dioxygenase [Chlamydiales bacterium]|nr:Validamycin A dioxygenase [Chlamydiales bacterium]MCH9636257.1 Validamycin A dioxygenase [Chlamydiales bacterium]MCH9703309.1 hypothetical protein [Chlamydiota bacterium]
MKLLFSLSLLLSSLFAFDATIPVLHLPDYYDESKRAQFLEQLEEACCEVGFFAITGTGVDPDMLELAYSDTATFFKLQFEEKLDYQAKDGQRGYVVTETAKGEANPDFKEYYHIGRDVGGFYENVWPTNPATFYSSLRALFVSLDRFQAVIGEMLERLLLQKAGFINEMISDGDCLLRAIHYPAACPKDQIWAGAHTDIDLFTILPKSTARGLQVLNKQDEWVDVLVPDGAFVINCGDMLENLSNGYFRSSFHRVIDPGLGQERYSIVYFVHPKSFDRLDPLPHFIEKTGGVRRYANLNRLELLAERLIDLKVASYELMKFFVESGAIEKLKEVGRFSESAELALREAGFDV